MAKKMRKAFREAAAIAEELPDELRETAFNRALDHLLAKQRAPEIQAPPQAPQPDTAAAEDLVGISFDLLSLATKRFGLDPKSGRAIFTKLNAALQRENQHTRETWLLHSAELLMRTAAFGGGTVFRMCFPETPADPPPERRRKTARKQPEPSKDHPYGATQLVRDLISIGFFTGARTAADVVLYLQREGVRLSSQELAASLTRLMKAGLLARRKNRAGKYEYTSV